MKLIDAELSTCIDFDIGNNDKDPKFKVGVHARISKYKNIFANGYTPNWSKEASVIKKSRNTVEWIYVKGKEIRGKGSVAMFYEKELQKNKSQSLVIKK